jgi:hypothetical protein
MVEKCGSQGNTFSVAEMFFSVSQKTERENNAFLLYRDIFPAKKLPKFYEQMM